MEQSSILGCPLSCCKRHHLGNYWACRMGKPRFNLPTIPS